MRFLIVGDLHGAKPEIQFKGFDAIIAPGDLCSDAGIRKYSAMVYQEFLKDPYNYRNWWEIAGKKQAKKLINKSVNDGRAILKFLSSFSKPVYLVPGNWDWTKGPKEGWDYLNQDFFKDYMLKGLKNVVNLHRKLKSTKDYSFIGYGICSGPELYTYRDYDKILKKKDKEHNKKRFKKLLDKYDSLFKRAKLRKKPVIFLSHNVPYNTRLDKITDKSSPRYGYHYGSVIARKMIEKHQPLVCVGGHMHEHFGKDRIGSTTVINAGYGPNVNTLLEIEGNKIKGLKFSRLK